MIFSALAGFRPDGFRVWVLPSVLLGSKGAQSSDCEKEGALSQERDPLHRLRRFAHRAQRLLRPFTMGPLSEGVVSGFTGFPGSLWSSLSLSYACLATVKHTC